MTADGMYADIVLPGTTNFENLGYERYPGGYCQLRQRVIDPIGEAKSAYTFLTELAQPAWDTETFPATEEDYVRFAFKGRARYPWRISRHIRKGVRYDAGKQEYQKVRQRVAALGGKPGFNTPSGKIELVSSRSQKYGYDGLPVYVEPTEGPLGSPEILKDIPSCAEYRGQAPVGVSIPAFEHSWAVEAAPKPQVLIHPADAEAQGHSDGGEVWVESPRGEVGVWAKVTDDVMTGQVELNVGGGSPIHAEAWREANANYLTDFENRDPISGFPVYKALLCEVKKRD